MEIKTTLEIYDYIGDCISGKNDEIIEWDIKWVKAEDVRKILDSVKSLNRFTMIELLNEFDDGLSQSKGVNENGSRKV